MITFDGGDVQRTFNGGTTWKRIGALPLDIVLDTVASHESTVVAIGDTGVVVSLDGGVTWTIHASPFTSVPELWHDGTGWFAFTGELGVRTTKDFSSWSPTKKRGWTMIRGALGVRIDQRFISMSSDGGATWTRSAHGGIGETAWTDGSKILVGGERGRIWRMQ